jgi:hypothetical protein
MVRSEARVSPRNPDVDWNRDSRNDLIALVTILVQRLSNEVRCGDSGSARK